MIAALAALAAGAQCAVLWRRLDRVGDAEHELRGTLTAFGLGLEAVAREPRGRLLAASLATELERARAALADLAAARGGGGKAARTGGGGAARTRAASAAGAEAVCLERAVRAAAAAWLPAARAAGRRVEIDWRAGPVSVRADRGRLAQALGNVLANAVEHGSGPVRVEAARAGARLRLRVVNGVERGRGLRIASRAVADCGGQLSVARSASEAAAVIDLPLAS